MRVYRERVRNSGIVNIMTAGSLAPSRRFVPKVSRSRSAFAKDGTKTALVLEALIEGKYGSNIARAIGVSEALVSKTRSEALRRRLISDAWDPIGIHLGASAPDQRLMGEINQEATARGISAADLIHALVRVIAADDLFDAVLGESP